MGDTAYSADQVEQLLRCPICLDRLSNPKILPCQHTFCKSPCLEGIIDIRSRRIKCPECRKEHMVPRNGADSFPTNITISGFLDLPTQRVNPQEAEPTTPSSPVETANRCGVCEQEAETVKCFHCNKMVCESCKRSHTGQIKLDVTRLTSQIRRALPKLSNCIAGVEQKSEQVKQQFDGVKSEVHNTVENFTKDLNEREKLLNSELGTLLQGEIRGLRLHQENLEVELASISSYCDATDSLLSQPDAEIPEADMVSMRNQCSEYMQHLRNAEDAPQTRPVCFKFDAGALHSCISNLGELSLVPPTNQSDTPAEPTPSNPNRLLNRREWVSNSPSVPITTQPASGVRFSVPHTVARGRTRPSRSDMFQARPAGVASRPSSHPPANYEFPSRTNDILSSTDSDYMFRMSTSTEDILQWMEHVRIEEEARPVAVSNRPHGHNRSVRDRQRDVERTGGFVSGFAGSVSHPPRRRAPLPPAAAFVVPLNDNEPGNAVETRRRPRNHRGRIQGSPGQNNGSVNTTTTTNTTSNSSSNNAESTASNVTQSASANQSTSNTPSESSNSNNHTSRPESPHGEPMQRRNTFVQEDGPTVASVLMPTIHNRSVGFSIPVGNTQNEASVDSSNSSANRTNDSRSSDEQNSTDRENRARTNPNNSRNENAGDRSGTINENNGEVSPSSSGTSGNESGVSEHRGVNSNSDLSRTNGELSVLSETTGQASTSRAGSVPNEESAPPTPEFRCMNYRLKNQAVTKLGNRKGNGQGSFNSPRGVAVCNSKIFVADSSNHRIQIFDSRGVFLKKFGSYGQANGEFDCLAGIACSPAKEIVVADRYNHRIQIFNQSGKFIRKFGQEGTGDGQLSYPWGVSCDWAGFIYVCDLENHRIQIFKPDGTFVRKFGSLGPRLGQFDKHHYVSVGLNNQVYVSDTNNHRIQVFSNTGHFVKSFGAKGSGNGQLKHPRGIVVDRDGYVVVCDSGNSRVQVFNRSGTYYCHFVVRGSSARHAKGLEGIAFDSNGTVIVSDKDDHIVQVF